MRRWTTREWLTESVLAVAAILLGVFFTMNTLSDEAAWPVPVEAVAGAVAVAALVAFRRRRPVALTVFLIPASILFAMPMGALPVALFAVGLYRPARVAVPLAAVHTGAVTVTYLVALGFTRTYVESVIFMTLLHVSVVAVAMLMRSHRRLVRSLADRARQAEEGQRMRIDQARLAERERIAREMHDVLAHRISLLAVHAGALEVRRDAPAEEREVAGLVRRGAYDALEDLREVVHMLREQDGERPQPTLADLPALADQTREAGTPVELELDGAEAVPAGLGRHAYRVVQEALTNARKHAPGEPVRVAVHGHADTGLVVEVGNPLGRPIGLPGAGHGLIGLGERVQLAGGRLDHGPTAAGTFEVRAWLPWPA